METISTVTPPDAKETRGYFRYMGTHAKLSPSAAERWYNCPGSLNLIATLPESAFKTNKYAVEGVVAHQLAEDFVSGKVDLLTLTSRVGEEVMQEGYPVTIDDAMIEGVIEYVDHIASIKKRLSSTPLGKVHPPKGKAEVRVIASSVSEEVYGTADYLIYGIGAELHVIDFKYGKGVVEAEENKQGGIYVVGAEDSVTTAVFEKFFFHIVQPRARHSEGTVRTWEISNDRLEKFREELKAAVARPKDQKAPRVAGPWCHKTFCPALAYCAEARGAIEAGVQTVFTKIPAPPSKEVALGMVYPDIGKMTIEQLGRVLDHEDFLDSFMGAARERMHAELLKDPNCSTDYKLVEGKTNRSWSIESEVETAFAMLGDELYTKKLKSPAQLEKLAGKEEVAKYTVKLAGRLTVAKMSDKRQAAGPVAPGSASGVFGVIETTATKAGAEEENIFGDLGGPTLPDRTKLLGPADRRGPLWPS